MSTEGRLRRVAPSSLTGNDLAGEALALAGRLHAALDGRAPVAVLALPAGLPFITAFLAALLGGITAVPVALPRAGSQSDRFARIVADCGASLIICRGADRALLARGLAAWPQGDRQTPILALEDLPAAPAFAGDADVAGAGWPQIIQYTSGSSRFPRGVALTGANILANATMVGQLWGMGEDTVVVNWQPHFHDMGLMGGILYPLLRGGVSVQLAPEDMIQRPIRWLRAISDHRGTFSGGPTFAFARCLDHVRDAECEGLDLSTWREAYCGAEPVHAEVLERFRRRFGPHGLAPSAVHACYGMAEYTLFAAGERIDGPHRAAARRGAPAARPPAGCAAVEPCHLSPDSRGNIVIVDPQTCRPVDDGGVGEIWLRGPSKAPSYVNGGEDAAALFQARLADGGDDGGDGGPWLRTGDLGIIAEDALYVTGRLKDTLTVNGRKVAAPELEWVAAAQHPALNPLAAAAFMPDAMASGKAVLLIEHRDRTVTLTGAEAAAVETRIRRAILGEWGIDLTDIRFLPRGTLERTTSGKIRRARIAEHYARDASIGSRHEEEAS